MNGLQVGFARARMTPPVGAYMAGYAAREGPSIGVHDDLFASAVALSDGVQSVVVLAMDICSFDAESIIELKGAIRQATGLPPEAVLLNTSHTHAGPMTARRAYQPFEPAYLGGLGVICARVVAEALADLQPATLSVGAAPVEIAVNRRQKRADGQVQLGQNLGGARLPEVMVWRLARQPGPDVVVWSTPVHGVALSHENRLISAEWMGATVRVLEANQPGLRAVFLQGCCGDQNPIAVESGFKRVDIIGAMAADAVWTALRAARPVAALPLRNIWREALLPLAEGGTLGHPIHGLRLGDAVIVGLAGEPFVEYALYGRKQSPTASTLILGYTDGTLGYFPTEAAYAEGGYEPGAYIWYTDGKALDPSIERVIKSELDEMLAHLLA